MKKNQIAITIRSFDTQSDYFQKLQDLFEISYVNHSGYRLEKSELIQVIKDSEGVIAGTEQFDREVLDLAPSLKVISRVGVGTDSIDINYARLHNIQVFNTPNAPVKAVAEHTLTLMLSLLKHIPQYDQNVRKGNLTVGAGELLGEKTIGIIGLGRIGFQVASILSCFGSKIIFFDPYLTAKSGIPQAWIQMENLESLLACADIITLHATPSVENQPLLNMQSFSSCKKGIIIINTARESLIDEKALISAIKGGIVDGIALDVFDKNHIPALIDATPNVILTPHIASNTRQSRKEMENESVKNLIQGLRGIS
jgi:D-3-phosphoglycerate dehydrogenase